MSSVRTHWLEARPFTEADTGRLVVWAAQQDAPAFLSGDVAQNPAKAVEAFLRVARDDENTYLALHYLREGGRPETEARSDVIIAPQATRFCSAHFGAHTQRFDGMKEWVAEFGPAACVVVSPDQRIGAVHVDPVLSQDKVFIATLQEWIKASGYKTADVVELIPHSTRQPATPKGRIVAVA